MPKFFPSDPSCRYVTVDRTGNRYDADRAGFISVDNPRDAERLKQGGYVEESHQPHTRRRWLCECGWEAIINSCPKCERTDLTRVEG